MDAVLFVLSFWVAHVIRSHWEIEIWGGTKEIQPFTFYAWLIVFIFPFGPLILQWQGFYERSSLSSRRMIVWQLVCGSALLTLIIISVMFLFKSHLSRAVVILFGVISPGLILGKEQLARFWVQSRWGKSQLIRRFVVVGTAADNERLRRELREKSADSLAIIAELDLKTTPIENLVGMLHEHSANGVILNTQHVFFSQIEKAIQICELEGVEAWLLADFFKTQISRTMLDDLADRPVLVFRSTPEESWQAFAKQAIDLTGAALMLVVCSPLLLLVAVLIKWTTPGPVFFRQQRSGLNGQPFTMLKFRSMASDAEQHKHELEALNEMSGPVFKVTNDPRITPIGRWLRRKSIDELPQLWNVVKGEMSLVGPRPLPVDEVNRFDDLSHRRRLSVKPGLTCLWQISGRNNVKDFKTWVRLDLEYIDNWSLWLDLKIIFRTIPVVLWGTGAR